MNRFVSFKHRILILLLFLHERDKDTNYDKWKYKNMKISTGFELLKKNENNNFFFTEIAKLNSFCNPSLAFLIKIRDDQSFDQSSGQRQRSVSLSAVSVKC